jgi:hypothetical protein
MNLVPHCRLKRLLLAFAVVAFATATLPARASIAFLMEEPYGEFGAFNPTGHAAIYLNHVCAASPTELRPCHPGELGVVISRYHRIDGDDWIAMPLIPYLYAVDDVADVPASVTREDVTRIRDAYWKEHLTALAPPDKDGNPPKGDWTQLVGACFDRRIHGFLMDSTPDQDAHIIAYFSDKSNKSHFNLFFHNCADFSKGVLDIYFPHSIHRNFIADAGITTPKQVARSLVKYGKKHPEIHMSGFVIDQVPGTVKRSHPVDGVAESLVKSKKYIIPLVILQPEVAGGVVVSYLADGRLSLPKNVRVYNAGDFDTSGFGDVNPIEGLAKDPTPKPI